MIFLAKSFCLLLLLHHWFCIDFYLHLATKQIVSDCDVNESAPSFDSSTGFHLHWAVNMRISEKSFWSGGVGTTAHDGVSLPEQPISMPPAAHQFILSQLSRRMPFPFLIWKFCRLPFCWCLQVFCCPFGSIHQCLHSGKLLTGRLWSGETT